MDLLQVKKFLFAHLFNFCYILCWMILLFGSYYPFFGNFLRTPTDRFYYGGDHYSIDLTGNITHVRQGYEGEQFAKFMVTTDFPTKPFFLKYEYILIGKFARIVQVDPYQAIIISRLFLSFIWFILIHFLIKQLFSSATQRIAAAIFILFGTSVAFSSISWFLKGVVNDVLVFHRFTLAMPHYLIGGISGILAIYFLSQALSKKHIVRNMIFCSITVIISALTYGPTVVLILTTFPVYLVLKSIAIRRFSFNKRELLCLGIIAGLVVLILLYVRYIVAISSGEYNLSERMEFLNPFRVHSFSEYVLGIGITYLFAVLALPQIVKKPDPLRLLLYGWVIMHPIGEFLISPLLDLNPIRFFLISYAVPFGLLATDGVSFFADLLKRIVKIPMFISVSGMVLVTLLSSFEVYKYIFYERIPVCFCYQPLMDLSYPKKELMEGIFWLRDHTKNSDIVMSQGFAGLLIPAFAGNDVLISRWYQMSGNPQFIVTSDTAGWLYSTQMPEETARNFLKENNIAYIFSSEEERQYTNIVDLPYSFLKEVFKNETVKIYKVTLENDKK